MRFTGNERADALARIGFSESPRTAEPHIGLSNRQEASALSDWTLEGTTETWRKAEGCRQAKELIGIPSDAKAKSKWLMSRRRWVLKTVVAVLTGHCGLNRHLHLLGIDDSPV